MSILDTYRGYTNCRGLSRRQVVRKVGRLQREANDSACRLIAMAREINELKAHFDQAAIAYSGALDDLRISKGETARALEALTAAEARLANALAVSDLPQHVSTQPVPTVQQRFEDGPVIRLGFSPTAVTDPGQPRAASWGVDDTQPLPQVEPPAA